jgi:hypothetical protein
MKWKTETTHDVRGLVASVTHEASAGSFMLIVHRDPYYDTGEWLLTIPGALRARNLETGIATEAMARAEEHARGIFATALADLDVLEEDEP